MVITIDALKSPNHKTCCRIFFAEKLFFNSSSLLWNLICILKFFLKFTTTTALNTVLTARTIQRKKFLVIINKI